MAMGTPLKQKLFKKLFSKVTEGGGYAPAMTADRSAPDLTGGPSAPAPSRRADPVDEIVAAWRKELPELDLLVMQLVKRAARLTGLIDAVTVAELDRLGRTKADYEVLSRLRAAGAPYQLKPHELASELLLSSGGTTNVLHRLTAAGLLVRHADPADRRSVWVRLTPTG
jgi:DNA-binding MarR family transcriptional regulator